MINKILNPLYKPEIVALVIYDIISLLLSIYLYNIDIIASYILLIHAISFPFFVFYITIFHRPKFVSVMDSGILLEFRFSKSQFIEYDRIKWVIPNLPRYYDGGIGVKGKLGYHMTRQICGEIINGYAQKMGRNPPERL